MTENKFENLAPLAIDGEPPLQLKPSSSRAETIDTYHEIELHRGSRGFGFSIRGGREFNGMPLSVLNIAKGGPADMDGRLMVQSTYVALAVGFGLW